MSVYWLASSVFHFSLAKLGLKVMLHQAIRNDDFEIQDSRELGIQSEKLSILEVVKRSGSWLAL